LGLISSWKQWIAIDDPFGLQRLYENQSYPCSTADWALSDHHWTPAFEQIERKRFGLIGTDYRLISMGASAISREAINAACAQLS
jgi:hypothetical protein